MTVQGTIFDIKKYAIHDGPGIRTTVFFKGCPLDCWWCHNPEGIKKEPETFTVRTRSKEPGSPGEGEERVIGRTGTGEKRVIGRTATVDSLMEKVVKDTTFYDQSGGGVTISGGEPMMQMEFLVGLLDSCKKAGIHTALDTSGYAPWEEFERVYDLVDIFLYDVKVMDDREHLKYTGVSNELILGNMRALSGMGEKVIPRIPMIPGITDTETNLEAIANYLSTLDNIREISLLPYNRIGEDKFKRFGIENRVGRLEPQTKTELGARGRRFESLGYKVNLGG